MMPISYFIQENVKQYIVQVEKNSNYAIDNPVRESIVPSN